VTRSPLTTAALAIAIALVSNCASAEGRDERIPNRNPNRTWADHVSGWISSGKSVAVVIGISNYGGPGGYPPLPTAKADADKMVKFLLDDAGFDVIYVLTDEKATKARISHLMIDEIPSLVGPNDRFLFYWSGHGDQKVRADSLIKFGYLPLANSKQGQEFSEMVSMDEISVWDQHIASRHTLFILDACLSGLVGVEKKAARDDRLDQLSEPAHYLLTAGTEKESVISSERWTGSLFTDSFIRGAKGEAPSYSGLVTLNSLIDFIKYRVVVEKNAVHWARSLNPQMRDLRGGNGSFFFPIPEQRKPESILAVAPPKVDVKSPGILDELPDSNATKKQPTVAPKKFASKLVQYVIPNSPIFVPGEMIKVKIGAASRYVKAFAVFPFESGSRSKVEAVYNISEGGLYMSYKIPHSARKGFYEISVYVQEIQTKAEEKHTVEIEIR
jgi:hypothetical protein